MLRTRLGTGARSEGRHPRRRRVLVGSETNKQYYPRRRRAGWCSIICANGALGLLIVDDLFELAAYVLEVIRADAHLENFLDHRHEVSQGANRAQRWGIGGTHQAARRLMR